MKKVLLVLPLLAVLLFVNLWFSKGLIIGSGESAIPFYHPQRMQYLTSSTWEDQILGVPSSFTLVSAPFYGLIGFVSHSIGDVHTQFLVFCLLALISTLGFILMSNNKENFFIISSLFYVFNLISVVLVWNRLQYPYIFFYTSLPVLFFVFTKMMEGRKRTYFYVLILLFFIFSLTFASIPILELFWIILGLYLIFFILLNWKNWIRIVFAIGIFVSLVIGWVIVNSFWFLQFFKVLTASSFISGFYTVSGDTTTLVTLSSQLGNLSYIFRLMHAEFFASISQIWGHIYTSVPFIIISFIIPFLAFSPLLIKKKPKILYYFLGLSLIIVFLMKGTAEPFGSVFFFLFTHIRVLEAFRNPFEKFGLALPFAYAPLIGYGSLMFFKYVKRKYNLKLAFGLIIGTAFLLFGVLAFPMWNGWVFTSNIPPANNLKIGDYVQVPNYYTEANSWLNLDKTDYRNIALPIGGEGITYTWPYGYSGVELSNSLFDKPFISLDTTIPFLNTISSQLEQIFFQNPQDFTKVMTLVGAKYLMVRSDVDYVYRNMTEPSLFTERIKAGQTTGLSYKKTFGKLSFYVNTNPSPLIYAAKDIYMVDRQLPLTDAISLTSFKVGDTFLDIASNPVLDKKTFVDTKTSIISPNFSISDIHSQTTATTTATLSLPYIRFLPTSPFYPILRLKENFDIALEESNLNKFFIYMDLMDKRLAELNRSIQQDDGSSIGQSSDNYKEQLEAVNKYLQANKNILSENLNYFRQKVNDQEIILGGMLNSNVNLSYKKKINMDLDSLTAFGKDNGALPMYPPIEESASKDREIFDYDIKNPGNYNVLLKNNSLTTYNNISLSQKIQVNNKLEQVSFSTTQPWINLGNFFFKGGDNQIQFVIPGAKNLFLSTTDSGKITTLKYDASKSIYINDYDPYASYTLTLSYQTKEGCADARIITGNSNATIWTTGFGCTKNSPGWNTMSYVISPNSGFSKSAQLQLRVYSKGGKATFIYKDLKITRNFDNQIVLKYTNPNYKYTPKPQINFIKVNPAKYIVQVKSAKAPFYLVFLESYHPLWKVLYPDNNVQLPEKDHFLVNSFANGWYINRLGTYTMVIEFSAENYFTLGITISVLAILISIFALIIYYIRYWKEKR